MNVAVIAHVTAIVIGSGVAFTITTACAITLRGSRPADRRVAENPRFDEGEQLV